MRHVLLLMLVISSLTAAEVTTQTINYADGDVALRGFLAQPKDIKDNTPAVLITHDWYGNGPYSEQRARELAEHGYIAFALDMYGDGKVVSTNEEASALAGAFYKDLPLMVKRARAGLAALRAQPHVDQKRIAAIGFCFGGTVTLNLARAGEPLLGAVSFHGGLKVALPVEPGGIKAKVLVLHGGSDPYVPPADLANFMTEMVTAKADWRTEIYGDAVHSFTKLGAGNDPSKGAAYNAEAERRSMATMYAFFEEIFATK